MIKKIQKSLLTNLSIKMDSIILELRDLKKTNQNLQETISDFNQQVDEIKEEIQEIKYTISSSGEDIKEIIIDVSTQIDDVHQELVTQLDEIQEQFLEDFSEDLYLLPCLEEEQTIKYYFILYKISDQIYGFIQGSEDQALEKLKQLKPKHIVLSQKFPYIINFDRLLKEEVKRRNRNLRRIIANRLIREFQSIQLTCLDSRERIEEEFEALRGFMIKNNIIYLNTSTIMDVLDFYHGLIEERQI